MRICRYCLIYVKNKKLIIQLNNQLRDSEKLYAISCSLEKGMLIPPEDGVGAEGCWMGGEK